MGLLKRRWGTWVLLGVILGSAYLLTRLVNLTLLPIFTDEAIYIRWSQIGTRDANWRFISLVDGKQPMFTWITMVLLRIIRDPLVAGRLTSVIAGAGSMVGIWLLTYELFKEKKIAFLASFLYLACPFTLMYDRVALYDSLVATCSIWNLYLAIILVRRLRLDVALLFGMMLGAGMLNKSSGFLSLYMVPATLFLFDWGKKKRILRFLTWVGLVLVSAVVSQAMYSILRLSPLFAMVGLKDTVFVYTFKEFLSHPFNFFVGNMHGLLDWMITYLTWPVFIISLVPLVLFWKFLKEKIILYIWWAVPMVALALFGRVLYPRFVLFMSMPLLVLAANGLYEIGGIVRKKYLLVGIFMLILLMSFVADYYLLTNPGKAAIPKSDKGQMINDWPSGGGAREVVEFLHAESVKGPLMVYTEGTFGLMPYSLELYLVDDPNIEIRAIWPLPITFPEEIETSASVKPTYVVTNETQKQPDWPLTLLEAYPKGDNPNVSMRLYKVVPVGKN
jgi:4-amino-4-deoxy-L-arabinose transferase-like glycosyltransferase